MRAVAVLLVMFDHADVRRLAGGYVGVDIFFVISGFLITGILAREVMRDGRVSILDFYARRARRILPAATVVLVATVAVSAFVYRSANTHRVLIDSAWATLFSENLNLARQHTDYFALNAFTSPVTFFMGLEARLLVARPGMTYFPCRTHDPGGVVTGFWWRGLIADRDTAVRSGPSRVGRSLRNVGAASFA